MVSKVVETPTIGFEVSEVRAEMPEWAQPITKFLATGELPTEKEEARNVRNKVARFTLLIETLYKQGISSPLLRCVSLDESQYVMVEIHEGVCGNHSGIRALVRKVLRVGYYWLHTLRDVEQFVKKCRCQEYAPILHNPPKN